MILGLRVPAVDLNGSGYVRNVRLPGFLHPVRRSHTRTDPSR